MQVVQIGETLVRPDRFGNTKSGWPCMVSLNIELAQAEIIAASPARGLGELKKVLYL